MGRCLRFVPEGGALVEVTTRTIQGRLLLRPSPAVNEIVLGVLGRAQRIYDVGISAVVVLSNHYHCLLRIRDAKQLADLMCYFNSNLAREIGRLVGWRDKIWSRRFTAVVVSGEPEAQRNRLKYLLGHGVKEFLVERTREWPGVHSVRALLDGEPLVGYWFDRTQEFAARQRGEEYGRFEHAERETVTLSPLPCWEDLPAEEQKRRVAEIVHEVESEAAAHREKTGTVPMGAVRQPFGSRIRTTNHNARRSHLHHSSTLRARGSVTISAPTTTPFSPPSAKRLVGSRRESFP